MIHYEPLIELFKHYNDRSNIQVFMKGDADACWKLDGVDFVVDVPGIAAICGTLATGQDILINLDHVSAIVFEGGGEADGGGEPIITEENVRQFKKAKANNG
jgi:hypothetical protein